MIAFKRLYRGRLCRFSLSSYLQPHEKSASSISPVTGKTWESLLDSWENRRVSCSGGFPVPLFTCFVKSGYDRQKLVLTVLFTDKKPRIGLVLILHRPELLFLKQLQDPK
jgi:hypothetical protein